MGGSSPARHAGLPRAARTRPDRWQTGHLARRLALPAGTRRSMPGLCRSSCGRAAAVTSGSGSDRCKRRGCPARDERQSRAPTGHRHAAARYADCSPADRASIPPFITEHELRELQAQAKREGRPFDIQPYKAERIAAIAALKARTLAATGWDPSVSDIISALGYESPKGLDWWRTCSPRTTLTAAKKIEALLRLPSCPRLSTGSK